MRSLIVIIFLFVILIQSWREVVIYAYYHWQKAYIVENYCVNILRPELMCSGRCYVDDMIKQIDDATTDSSTCSNDLLLLPVWYLLESDTQKIFYPLSAQNANFQYQNYYKLLTSSFLFRPPRV